MLKIFCILLCSSPFITGIIYGLCSAYGGIYREIKYQKNCDKQHLMFSQLKKGDYVWEVQGATLIRHFIKKIEHKFIGNHLKEIKLYFRDGYTMEITPENAKTYKCGYKYTLMEEAKSVCAANRIARQKELDMLKNVSKEEIVKEVNAVIIRLNKIAEKI
jgi:hypothetical protein